MESDAIEIKQLDSEIRLVKGELETKLFYKTKGAMLRSKTQWYAEGEKCTKYYLGLEKVRFNDRFDPFIKDQSLKLQWVYSVR